MRRRREQTAGHPCLDLRRGVDRQRPLPALPGVALVRPAHRPRRYFREIVGRDERVDRRDAPLLRELADMRVIDDDQIVAARKLLDRIALEILQRAAIPDDLGATLPAPFGGCRDERIIAPRVIPGHAAHRNLLFRRIRRCPVDSV